MKSFLVSLDLKFSIVVFNEFEFVIVFIQHIPRINRDIPSVDEATSDHERLLNR